MAKIKRLFNDPYDVVEEMIEGYVSAHKEYVKMCDLDEAQGRVVLAKDAGTKDKVGVIIGGGSGHEPLFIGYVERTLLMVLLLVISIHLLHRIHVMQLQRLVITAKDVSIYTATTQEML